MTGIVPDLLRRYLPILTWGAECSPRTLASDLVAAAIVTIMLIPQSLAFLFWVRRGLKPHLTQYDAVSSINPNLALGTLEAQRL